MSFRLTRASQVALALLVLAAMSFAVATGAAGRPLQEARSGPPAPQCSDGVDNQDREDALADAEDPGCHSDRDASNASSYDPGDRSEQDRGGRPEPTPTPTPSPQPTPTPSPTPSPTPTPEPEPEGACRASVVRVGALEPLVANDQVTPCRSDSARLPRIDLVPGGPQVVSLELPRANTDESSASASVAHFDLWNPLEPEDSEWRFPLVHAQFLTATAGCSGFDGPGAQPSGGTQVAHLVIAPPGGQPQSIEVDPVGEESFDVGPLATVHTNQQERDGQTLTARALYIDTHGPLEQAVGDIVVAEAMYSEPPPRGECSAGGSRGH